MAKINIDNPENLIYSSGIIDLQALFELKEERGDRYTELYNAVQDARAEDPLVGNFFGNDMLATADRYHGLEKVRMNGDKASAIWHMIPGDMKKELESKGITPRNSNIEIYRMPMTRTISIEKMEGEKSPTFYCPMNLFEVNITSKDSEDTFKAHLMTDDGHGSPAPEHSEGMVILIDSADIKNPLTIDPNEANRQYDNDRSPFTRFRDESGNKFEAVKAAISNNDGLARAIDTKILPYVNELTDGVENKVEAGRGQCDEAKLLSAEIGILKNVLKSEIADKQTVVQDLHNTCNGIREIRNNITALDANKEKLSGMIENFDSLDKKIKNEFEEMIDVLNSADNSGSLDSIEEKLDEVLSFLGVEIANNDPIEEQGFESEEKEVNNEVETASVDTELDTEEDTKEEIKEKYNEIVNRIDSIKDKLESSLEPLKEKLVEKITEALVDFRDTTDKNTEIISKADEIMDKSSDKTDLNTVIDTFDTRMDVIDSVKDESENIAGAQDVETGRFYESKHVVTSLALSVSRINMVAASIEKGPTGSKIDSALESAKTFISENRDTIKEKTGDYKIELSEKEANTDVGVKVSFDDERNIVFLESDVEKTMDPKQAVTTIYETVNRVDEVLGTENDKLVDRLKPEFIANGLAEEEVLDRAIADVSIAPIDTPLDNGNPDSSGQLIDNKQSEQGIDKNNDGNKIKIESKPPKINPDAVPVFNDDNAKDKEFELRPGVVESIRKCNERITELDGMLPNHLLRSCFEYTSLKHELLSACVEYERLGGKIGEGELVERSLIEQSIKDPEKEITPEVGTARMALLRSDLKNDYLMAGILGLPMDEIDKKMEERLSSMSPSIVRSLFSASLAIGRPLLLMSYWEGKVLANPDIKGVFVDTWRQQAGIEINEEGKVVASGFVVSDQISKADNNLENNNNSNDIEKTANDPNDFENNPQDSLERNDQSDIDITENIDTQDENIDPEGDEINNDNVDGDTIKDDEQIENQESVSDENNMDNDINAEDNDDVENDKDPDEVNPWDFENTEEDSLDSDAFDNEEDKADGSEEDSEELNPWDLVEDQSKNEERDNVDANDADNDNIEESDDDDEDLLENQDNNIEQEGFEQNDLEETEDSHDAPDDEIDQQENSEAEKNDVSSSEQDLEESRMEDDHDPVDENAELEHEEKADDNLADTGTSEDEKKKDQAIPGDDFVEAPTSEKGEEQQDDLDQNSEGDTGFRSDAEKTPEDTEDVIEQTIDVAPTTSEDVTKAIQDAVAEIQSDYDPYDFDINEYLDAAYSVAETINNTDPEEFTNVNDATDSMYDLLTSGENPLEPRDASDITNAVFDNIDTPEMFESFKFGDYDFSKTNDEPWQLDNPKPADQQANDIDAVSSAVDNLSANLENYIGTLDNVLNEIDQIANDAVNDPASGVTNDNIDEYRSALQDGALLALNDKVEEMDATSMALYGATPDELFKNQGNDYDTSWQNMEQIPFDQSYNEVDNQAEREAQQQLAAYELAQNLAEQAKEYADNKIENNRDIGMSNEPDRVDYQKGNNDYDGYVAPSDIASDYGD